MTSATQSQRRRILVIDDDTSVLKLYPRLLPDYDVAITPDPYEALAGGHGFDLVISDYLMPSMTGDELLARLRAQNPDVETLLVTAHDRILDAEAPEWWTNQAHLAKPLERNLLRNTIAGLIGQ
jgi:CheY-like chemotaxis protein